MEHSPTPWFDLDYEFNLQQCILSMNKRKILKSAHDVSEGGLFFCLLESCFPRNFGFELNFVPNKLRKDAFLFGESQSRIVVTVNEDKLDEFTKLVVDFQVDIEKLGNVTENKISVFNKMFGSVDRWKSNYEKNLEKYLNN